MVEILPFSAEYIPQVSLLEKQIFSDPWGENALETFLLSPTGRGYVLLENGEFASYALCSSLLGEGEVLRIGTEKSHLRKGFAMALLEFYFAESRKEGVENIFLEVRSENRKARCLYEKAGFSLVGKRIGYYKKPTDDACIYQKNQNGNITL